MTTHHAHPNNRSQTQTGWLSPLDPNLVRGRSGLEYLVNTYTGLASRIHHRGYCTIIAYNVQAFKFRIMMREMAYACLAKEAVRVIKPKRKALVSMSYLEAVPSRFR